MILVTGGTGFIGSHACVELMSAGHDVIILDNLCNSKSKVVNGIGSIVGRPPILIEGDIRDAQLLEHLFTSYRFEAVMHFAGLKSVSESVTSPLKYYENNVYGSMVLLHAMSAHCIKRLVFSSSATVYGDPASLPIREDFPLQATNPYGRTKLMIEKILEDLVVADPSWSIATLRYFNPIGAHESGLIGEAPNGIPNNLLPYIAQVAVGQREYLSVYGCDYPTSDGTGVRDFIHVVDLALGHVKAMNFLSGKTGLHVYNLGTGQGYSVLEIIQAFEKSCGKAIPYKITQRRAGDIAQSYANVNKAREELRWEATRTLDQMCIDAWRWQNNFSRESLKQANSQ